MSKEGCKSALQTEENMAKDKANHAKENEPKKGESSDKNKQSQVPRSKMYLLGTAIMIVLLFFDQLTKYFVIQNLKKNSPFVLINGVLELCYVENTGSAFSLFQGQKTLILIMGIIVLAAAAFFLYKLPADRKFCIVHILVTIMIAGALGNMIDRIRFGYVIDFISFVLIHFPVFNVADCYVVVSAICLFVLFMFIYKEKDLEWIGSVLK